MALRQSTDGVFGAYFCTDVLGDTTMTDDVVALAIEPRGSDCVRNAHPKIEKVENRREDGSDDA